MNEEDHMSLLIVRKEQDVQTRHKMQEDFAICLNYTYTHSK